MREYTNFIKNKDVYQTPITSKVENRYFNTKQRHEIYTQYDKGLSGHTFTLPWADESKKYCDFDILKYDK